MASLSLYLVIFLVTTAVVTPGSSPQPCGHSAVFTLLPLNDVTFSQNVLYVRSSSSNLDCGRTCVGAEGCVMFTFQGSETGASGRCRVYGQVHNATQDHEVSPGARSYVLDMEAMFRVLHSGYFMVSGHCIRVVPENLSYLNATQRCLQLDGGHLLFTKTTEDLEFGHSIVQNYGVTRLWVGADDLQKEGEFRWKDGTLVSHMSLWALGEPDDFQGIQNCACLWQSDGKLHDCTCALFQKYPALTVCQKEL